MGHPAPGRKHSRYRRRRYHHIGRMPCSERQMEELCTCGLHPTCHVEALVSAEDAQVRWCGLPCGYSTHRNWSCRQITPSRGCNPTHLQYHPHGVVAVATPHALSRQVLGTAVLDVWLRGVVSAEIVSGANLLTITAWILTPSSAKSSVAAWVE
jgi:putative intracellular protease/amidase